MTGLYLDEDLSPIIAAIARSLGLDVASAQEDGRRGIDDIDMLLFAADAGRSLVSRNARDFRRLTLMFYERHLPHLGVLLLPSSVLGNEYSAIARALVAYVNDHPQGLAPYQLDYVPVRL